MKVFFGFILGAIALLGLIILLVLWSMYAMSNGALDVTGIVSAIGSITSGVASIVTALAAYLALNTWSKQLTVGKKLQIIWDSKTSLRKYRISEIFWYPKFYHFHKNKTDVNSVELREKLEIDILEEALKAAFDAFTVCTYSLDTTITKEGSLWTNRAQELNQTQQSIKLFIEQSSNVLHENNESLEILNNNLRKLAKECELKLDNLEADILKVEWRFWSNN